MHHGKLFEPVYQFDHGKIRLHLEELPAIGPAITRLYSAQLAPVPCRPSRMSLPFRVTTA
jgi:hypothetical protein